MLILELMNIKNNIKALIFDLDGTLLSTKKAVAPKTLESLISLKEQGMKIIIATGRPPLTGLQKLGKLNLKTPLVCANGACIYDPVTNLPLKEVSVNSPSIERILEIGQSTNKSVLIYTLKHTYIPQHDMDNYLTVSDAKESKKVSASILPSEDYRIGEELVYKCIIHSENIGYDREYLNYLKSNLEDLEQDLFITYAHPDFLEIVDKSINKYDSLSGLLKSLDIKDNEVIAFGDGINDMEMLGKFSYSVAMGNACDEVKEIATFKTESNDDEGIYKFLKKSNLI